MPETPHPILLHLESVAQTAKLAGAFARAMQAGDVVLLTGGLAAGKTLFVREAVAALGSKDAVSSPTYTLAHIYGSPKGPVVHVDAYRLESAADFADLALEDEVEQGLAFIEWGELLAGAFESYVGLSLALDPMVENARTATLTAHGSRGAALLAQVLKGSKS